MSGGGRTSALSRREMQVARAYGGGATYRDIADNLGIAPTTVRAHIHAVYRKLGVGSKMELARVLDGPEQGASRRNGTGLAGAAPAVRPSVAILPFENRSGVPEHGAIIAGLVDRTTSILSKFRLLRVISAASSLSYRENDRDIPTIGTELGARYLLRGSLFRADERMRVTAELLEMSSGTHVWSTSIDGTWSRIFDFQDELACSIAQAIEPEIRAREFRRARRGQQGSPDAWELYCRGFDAFQSFSEEGYRIARTHAETAISSDEDFAAPHSLLARIDFLELGLGVSHDPQASIMRGIAHGRRAIEIDDRDEVAHCCLSYCLVMAGAFDEAFFALRRAFDINPNNAEVYNARAFANVMAPEGDLDQVIADSEIALRMSPNDPMRWTFLSNIGMAHLANSGAASAEKALSAFREASLLPHAAWFANAGAALAALALGDQAETGSQIERAKLAKPDVTGQDLVRAFRHFMRRSEGARILTEQLAERLPQG